MHKPRRSLVRFLLNVEHRAARACHLDAVRKLPLLQRLTHPKTVRHAAASSLGLGISVSGAYLASHHVTFVPHFLWDFFAYAVHGLGLIPVAAHIEPLFKIVRGD